MFEFRRVGSALGVANSFTSTAAVPSNDSAARMSGRGRMGDLDTTGSRASSAIR